jgi:hypothetical protein
MEVRKGLVYPRQTMLDDVQINTSSFVVVKVDMVHDNSKDLKLKLPPDETTLTMRRAVATRVKWRRTSIDIDPAATASTSTSPASMSHEAQTGKPATTLVLRLNQDTVTTSFEAKPEKPLPPILRPNRRKPS